jgi:hypothetical protein
VPTAREPVRPLRDEPERVERVERVLRALRVEGVRPERADPVFPEPVAPGGPPFMGWVRAAVTAAAPAGAIPQALQYPSSIVPAQRG